MSLNCVDVSNYSGPLSVEQVADLKNAGIELGIVQSLDPPPGYPAGVTRQQIQALLDGGVAADAYVWLWFDADISDIQRKLDLLRGLPIGRVWLDIEDAAAAKYDQATTEAKVHDALVLCDQIRTTSGQIAGVYSGRWFWTDRRYMANTTAFSDRDLWDSDYDDVDDTGGFQSYGGWATRAIKQYHGTTTLAGVPNVDLNTLSADELARVEGGGGDVDAAERQAYEDRISGLQTAIYDMGDRLGDAIEAECARPNGAQPRKNTLRGIASQLHSEREQAVGPR